MKQLLMGIDVGTTHIKAAIFDICGKQEALSIKDNKVYYDSNGFSQYDPREIKTAIFGVISEAIEKISGKYEILGVGVTSMGEAGVPIDKDGNPLFDVITWFDQRTEKQIEWWSQKMDPFEIYKETGLLLEPRYSLNKIMWLKENKNEVYQKIAHWLCMEDYALYSLSGNIATDRSIANRTMAVNIKTNKLSDKMLDLAQVKGDIFSPIYNSGTIIGKVTKEVSELTSLKEGTPVVTGGLDHLCAAFATGAVKEGDIFDSLGTAEGLLAVKKNDEITMDHYKSGLCIDNYVIDSKYCIIGGITNCGGSVEWFARNFIKDGQKNVNSYEELNHISEKMLDSPSGIFYTPHIGGSGVNQNPLARGVFIGLRYEHSKMEILKSIYEGTCYESRAMIDIIKRFVDTKTDSIKTTGGCTKNQYWMDIRANVLNTELDIPMIEESAAMGAALLAGMATGVYGSVNEVFSTIDIKHKYIKFNKDLSSKYDYLYNNGYKQIYDAVNPINEVLRKYL